MACFLRMIAKNYQVLDYVKSRWLILFGVNFITFEVSHISLYICKNWLHSQIYIPQMNCVIENNDPKIFE